MRKLALSLFLVVLAALSLASAGAVAAKPAFFHDNFDETFTDTVCGIPVGGRAVGVDNFWPVFDASGQIVAFKDINSSKVTLTAANGKSVVIANAGQHTGSAAANPDGSITFNDTFKGLPERIFTPNGPVLVRDAGIISFATTFDAAGNVVSFEVLVEKGPHPEADSDFQVFCQVITSALT